jgi:hypothetical protein
MELKEIDAKLKELRSLTDELKKQRDLIQQRTGKISIWKNDAWHIMENENYEEERHDRFLYSRKKYPRKDGVVSAEEFDELVNCVKDLKSDYLAFYRRNNKSDEY